MKVLEHNNIRNFKEQFLSIIYPKVCFGCKKQLEPSCKIYLCVDCYNKLQSQMKPGESIPHFHFSRNYTASFYEGLVKDAICSIKYNDNTYLAETLAQLMIDYSLKYIQLEKIDAIAQIPLHWRKKRERGFNQSLLLAVKIGSSLNIPVIKKSVLRTKYTPSQIELSGKMRLSNVKGVFKAIKPNNFRGRRILLIDDVFTTGATLNECSKVIMEAGAKDIWAFTATKAT